MPYYVDSDGNTKYSDGNESIQVRSADDLPELAARFGEGIYVPGLIAYTAGYKAMWQLNADGEWENIVGGESDGE